MFMYAPLFSVASQYLGAEKTKSELSVSLSFIALFSHE